MCVCDSFHMTDRSIFNLSCWAIINRRHCYLAFVIWWYSLSAMTKNFVVLAILVVTTIDSIDTIVIIIIIMYYVRYVTG